MKQIFSHLDASIDVPDGTIVYKIDDAAKAFNFTPEQKQSCLLVLGDPISDTMTIVNQLGEVDNNAEYQQLVMFSIEQSKANGCTLTSQTKQTAPNGNILDIIKLATTQNDVYVVFVCFNNIVFMSSTSCNKQNFKKAQSFANELMSSICAMPL